MNEIKDGTKVERDEREDGVRSLSNNIKFQEEITGKNKSEPAPPLKNFPGISVPGSRSSAQGRIIRSSGLQGIECLGNSLEHLGEHNTVASRLNSDVPLPPLPSKIPIERPKSLPDSDATYRRSRL